MRHTVAAMQHYRLDSDNNPVACSVQEWCDWVTEVGDNGIVRVAYDELPGGEIVSTIVLPYDYSHGEAPKPCLFETMTCIKGEWGNCHRHYSWKQAEEWHGMVLGQVKTTLGYTDP